MKERRLHCFQSQDCDRQTSSLKEEWVKYAGAAKADEGMNRRGFLQTAIKAGIVGAVLALDPVPYKRGTAWAENKIPPEYWGLASRYGDPQGKFGKPGDPVAMTICFQPYCLCCQSANINKRGELWERHFPQGSQIKWFRSLSGSLITNNMLAGRSQVGYLCDTPGLRAMESVDCVTIQSSGYDTGEHGALVLRKDLWEKGKVKSLEDLDGARIGVSMGSPSHRQVLDIVYQFKIRPKLLDQSTEVQVTQMRAKKIDACVTWEPYSSYFEYLGIGVRLLTGHEMMCTCSQYYPEAQPHSWRTCNTTVAITPWLRDRPDVMMAWISAEEEAREIGMRDPDYAAYLIWQEIPEIPQSVVRVTMDMQIWDGSIVFSNTEGRNHFYGIAYQWREMGVLDTPKSASVKNFVDDYVDDRWIRLAYKEMREKGRWTGADLHGFPKYQLAHQARRHSWTDYKDIKLHDNPEWKMKGGV